MYVLGGNFLIPVTLAVFYSKILKMPMLLAVLGCYKLRTLAGLGGWRFLSLQEPLRVHYLLGPHLPWII